jgi:hypothetical protein
MKSGSWEVLVLRTLPHDAEFKMNLNLGFFPIILSIIGVKDRSADNLFRKDRSARLTKSLLSFRSLGAGLSLL